MIHSLAGTLPEGGLMTTRPYRDPHHSASLPALIGGGAKAKPGEISLAHRGVLFLDELPEFARGTLETGQALIARVNSHVTYPARFQLVAAMNPCRCGYLGDPGRECTKAPRCGADYQSRISGPLLDRIDIRIDVTPVSISDLSQPPGEASAPVAARIKAARDVQEGRGTLNAYAPSDSLEEMVELDAAARTLLNRAAEAMRLSARGYHRVLRVARTIADLDHGGGPVSEVQVAEALSLRQASAGGEV